MATQRLTIAKIAGAASVVTLDLFRDWQSKRLAEDPNEWSSEQWPEQVRRCADEWALNLRQHGHHPPVLFFAEYVDLWSFCPPDRHIGNEALIQIASERYELFCLPLPADADLVRYLRQLRKKGQYHEDRLFGKFTIEAFAAWGRMIDKAVVVFLREVLGGSTEDGEIERSLAVVPEWCGRDLINRCS